MCMPYKISVKIKPQPYSCTISSFSSYDFNTFEIIKTYEALSRYSEYDIDLLKDSLGINFL